MRNLILPVRLALIGIGCAAVAAAVLIWAVDLDVRDLVGWWPPATSPGSNPGPVIASLDPLAPADPAALVIEPGLLEDGGIGLAMRYSGSIRDPRSLAELKEAVEQRGTLGTVVQQAELDALETGPGAPADRLLRAAQVRKNLGLLAMYDGRFADADDQLAAAIDLGRRGRTSPKATAELVATRGIVALRIGEVSNCIACLGPSSCIFPIDPAAVHTQQAGSRAAIGHFRAYLAERPGDLRVRWLLNLAHMTLGEYPDKVPPEFLIPLDTFESKRDLGRFANVAATAGLTALGPNLAGGSVFDDFDGDGRPDLLSTSLDAGRGASLFVNNGDGTFDARSETAGLADQVYALNVARADVDNDGDLDVVLLRGGWEKAMRMSLLVNKGDGTFDDATLAAGLGEPIATEAAAWGDYDNDGFVDLFVCGEYRPPAPDPSGAFPEPRNRCRLYRNNGDGTFTNVAAAAGVAAELCAKGCAWGDYDDDGQLDLFVSNTIGPCRLFRNIGDGTFVDVAPELGVTGADRSFACWFWDYDNDGRLDLFVNDYSVSLAETAAIALGQRRASRSRPRLYRNEGAAGFRDVAAEVGLDRAFAPMGCNFGDVDNDGYLDIYLGTGGMSYEYLVPNAMLANIGGSKFEDVTMSSGTGHLQKGHGVSFADHDADGDLDLYVVAGGGVPGDSAFNTLFQNPGHGRHWLDLKLVGTTTNRAAIGAKIQATVVGPDGSTRSIYRTIGNNSSFGGNTLVEHLGLGEADRLDELSITWPAGGDPQDFRDLAADRAIVITEVSDAIAPLVAAPPVAE